MKKQISLFLMSMVAIAAVFLIGLDSAHAAAYPVKPVRLVVPFTTGGANDVLARTIAKELTERWGQPVLVDNRPGGGGSLGAGMVAKAAPDGYTILFVSTSFGLQPSLYRKLSFDTVKDFTGVAWVASEQNVLLVHSSVPAKSVKELVALAKSKPGQLNFASSGIGSAAHLRGELFKSATGTDIVHVPYKGTSPVLTDLLAGRVSMAFTDLFAPVPHIQAGKLRALAVNGSKRSHVLPDVPTMTEAGVPGFETGAWFGIVAPAATPKEIVEQLNTEILRALQLPSVKDRFTKLGLEPLGSTPEKFDAHIKSEVAKWAKVIKEAGIPVED